MGDTLVGRTTSCMDKKHRITLPFSELKRKPIYLNDVYDFLGAYFGYTQEALSKLMESVPGLTLSNYKRVYVDQQKRLTLPTNGHERWRIEGRGDHFIITPEELRTT